MAPKRGGGGGGSSSGSGGGISTSCPEPFADYLYRSASTKIVNFVNYCLFFVLTLAILIALCCVRGRHGSAKKLTGPIYMLSLLANLLAYALLIISTMLQECDTYDDPFAINNWRVAYVLFFQLANYLLLVVVVWSVNRVLRQRLGSGQGVYNAICLAILSVMGALTCGYIGLSAYNNWTITPDGQYQNAPSKFYDEARLIVAYFVLYMLSVLASGALSIVTLVSMRSKQIPVGGSLGCVIALIFCMFIWVLFHLVQDVSYLPEHQGLDIETDQAFTYLINFFQTFSYIAILFLARSLNKSSTQVPNPNTYQNPVYPAQPVQYGQAPPNQPQYAYNVQPGQQYQYQPQPVYVGPGDVSGHKA